MDVNIDEVAIEVEVGTNNFTNTIQQVLVNGNLFSLPCLIARKTHNNSSLFLKSCIEYLNIMQQKALEKEGNKKN